MPVMPIPNHESVGRDWMWEWLQAALADGPPASCLAVNDSFRNPLVPFGAETRVPFFVWCRSGTMDIPIAPDEKLPFSRRLERGGAALFAPGSMVNIEEDTAGTYLRVTMEPDLTLFMVSTRQTGVPLDAPSGAFHLRACTLPTPLPPAARRHVEELADCQADGGAHTLRARLLAGLLVADFADMLADAPAGDWSRARQTWAEIRTYVREHASRPISRKTVAAACGVHPGHISRLCARFAGESFSTVLNQERLERARVLLETTTLPVAEIAARNGFTSAAYFSSAFRKIYGHAPSASKRGGRSDIGFRKQAAPRRNSAPCR